MITISDEEAPVIANIPQDITVECDDIPAPQTPTATDNCDTDVDIQLDETTLGGACPEEYVLIRTWTATDDCGKQCYCFSVPYGTRYRSTGYRKTCHRTK
jgi:hypothetical protein